MGKDWFDAFGFVAVDECHLASSKELTGLMNSCRYAKYRIGVTGSLSKSVTNKMVIQGLFGDISKEVSTRDLIEQGYLSEISIACLILKYNKDTASLAKHMDYQKELSFLNMHDKRNSFISKLALLQKGNTLVLFTRIEHGEHIYELIKSTAAEGRKVFLVHGGVDADDRESIRKLTEVSDNAIIVASRLS